jgi:hypothetical protein
VTIATIADVCTATSEMEDLPDLRCAGCLRRGACSFDGPLGTCYVVYPNHETDRSIIGLDSVEEANLQYFCPFITSRGHDLAPNHGWRGEVRGAIGCPLRTPVARRRTSVRLRASLDDAVGKMRDPTALDHPRALQVDRRGWSAAQALFAVRTMWAMPLLGAIRVSCPSAHRTR